MNKLFAIALLANLLLSSAGQADEYAVTGASFNSGESLESKVALQDQELQSLRAQLDALTQSVEQGMPADGGVQEASYQPSAGKKPAPTYPSIKVNGFFQADSSWWSQDAVNMASVAAINGIPSGDVQDGFDFRRARSSASGDVAENIGYFMEYDFAFPGRPSFMDHVVDIRNVVGDATFRLGYWRQPIGMDALTSVKDLTFFERALPFAFLPFRQYGIGLYEGTDDSGGTWAVSAIRFPTDVFGGNVGDDGGYGVVGRTTHVIWSNDDHELFHMGGAFTFADPSSNQIQYQTQPEIFSSETGGAAILPPGVPSAVPPFVNTGPIAAQNFNLFGGELAFLYHSLYMQSELLYANVNQTAGPELSFWGAYAQVGYYLTGEQRPYNRKSGVFGRIDPICPFKTTSGWGAWEVAARWSTIDLNDENILGGRLNDVTLGLNWYLAKNFKFQFNQIHAFLNSPGFGDSDADITAIRAQVDF